MDEFQLPQVKIPKDMIHLGLGQPSPSLLPLGAIQKASAACLSNSENFFLAYGEEQGNEKFRNVLAGFLSADYGKSVDPDHLFITSGASQALDLICSLFTVPGDTVLVEEPSYFLALKVFSDHGLNMVSIPMDKNGLKVDVLEALLNQYSPAFLYTIPTFHNPSGITLSKDRREKVADLCARKNLLVIADEVYHCLSYTSAPPMPMACLSHRAPILSLGSFSKILAPGLRLGWIQAGPALIEKLTKCGLLQSGGGLNPFTSEIVTAVIRSGFLEENIKLLKNVYSKRVTTLIKAINQELPQPFSFIPPEGGFFLWLEFPENVNLAEIRKRSKTATVDFFPGTIFSSTRALNHCMRLSFAFYDEPHLKTGIRRLGNLLKKNIASP